jgi:FMN phosphatase YigB (HAD superfamily)
VSTTNSSRVPAAPSPRPVVVFDFDGTVCIGDEPVRAYATAVLARSEATPAAVAEVTEALESFLSGRDGAGDFLDGYAAVAALTAPFATPEQQEDAYQSTRRDLADGGIFVMAPAGLAALLHELAPLAERILVTNAPETGIASTLDTIGLGGCFDRVFTSAGKPSGWAAILPELTTAAGRPAEQVLSIGDIWANDLAEPFAAGAAVFLIDRFGAASASASAPTLAPVGPAGPATETPHAAAATIEQLYPAIRAWAQSPAAFGAAASAEPELEASA